MTQFVNNDVASGNVIYASDHNEQGSRLAAVINGGLDNNNVASGAAIATSKLADDAGITTAKLADGAITAPKLDATATGHGFLEIARTTLTVAGDALDVSAIPARRHLRVIVRPIATGGPLDTTMRFNNDSGANYGQRYITQFANVVSVATANDLLFEQSTIASGATGYTLMDIENDATLEKLATWQTISNTATGVNAPSVVSSVAKWANSSVQINRITITNVSGSGDFAIGSEIIVFGRD